MNTKLKDLIEELDNTTKKYKNREITEHEHISEQYRISTLILRNHNKELTTKQKIGLKTIQQFARGGLKVISLKDRKA